MALIRANEKVYKVKISSYKELFQKFDFIIKLSIGISLASLLFSYINIVFLDNISLTTAKMFFLSSIFIITFGLIYYFSFDNSLIKLNNSLQKNDEKSKYQISFGREVKEFLGSGMLSLAPNNLTGRYILADGELIKRMGAVIGTTGSGKTVQLKGMLEQQLALGGGAFCIDAKGTIDELKNVYALVGKYGRLKDLYVINFANPANSHSINLLNNGKVLTIKEMLIELIDVSEDVWGQQMVSVLTNILKLMVYKRDFEKKNISFADLSEANNLSFLAKEAIKYKNNPSSWEENQDLKDFIAYVCTACNVIYSDFTKKTNKIGIDGKLTALDEKLITNSENPDLQGVIYFNSASSRWADVFTTLNSNYGRIMSSSYPDLDLYEAVSSGKIIWTVLPTVESEKTARMIGRLMLGLIKTVGDKKIKRSFEPKIPFLFLLDEFGSFGVKGFGRFMSKARSLGMSFYLYFQSIAQLDSIDDGKGLEKKEILDMCNILIVMRNQDEALPEVLSKKVPEEISLEHLIARDNSGMLDNKKKNNDENKIAYTVDKKQAFRGSDFSKLKDGEMYFFVGGDAYKCVAQAQTDFNLTYEKKNVDVVFALTKTFPKKLLINYLKKTIHGCDENYFYNN